MYNHDAPVLDLCWSAVSLGFSNITAFVSEALLHALL
jgi:hypothetical protein